MTYYEHKRFWPLGVVVVIACFLGPGVATLRWGLAEQAILWPAHLFVIAVACWFYFIVGRHANRHVRVDAEGLWIDGELVVEAKDILALGLDGDPLYGHLVHVGTDLPRPRDHPTRFRTQWLQHNWARLVHAPGIDTVGVITRARDLTRATWMDGVTIITKRWYAKGHREAWIIGAYRLTDLGEALSRAAPHAHLIFDHDPQEAQSAAPGPSAAEADDSVR